MNISIRYMNVEMPLEIPETAVCDEHYCKAMKEYSTSESFITDIKSKSTDLFDIKSADLFVVNDAYRPTPTATILEWLNSNDLLNGTARFLVATGTHAAPNQEQLFRIFGNMTSKLKDRIIIHDAFDNNSMTTIGNDDAVSVLINKAFAEAKYPVVIGSVEPHYFAGFTGGRKAIFPGLCDHETTVRNHNRAVSRKAQPMKLDGNPVEKHLQRLMAFVNHKKIFGIQIVSTLDSDGMIIFWGELHDAFNRAREIARKVYGAEIKQHYDLLLAEVLPPLDNNLYQVQKALENCQSAVSDDGTIMLFSACREGIGSSAFYHLAEKWTPGMELTGPESFGLHKLSRVYDIGQRINVCLFSELPVELPGKVYYHPVRSPQMILDNYFEDNNNARMAIVRDAGHTVMTAN